MQSPQTPSTCPKSTKFNPLLSSTYKQVKHGPVTWSEPYRETETSPNLDRCSIQIVEGSNMIVLTVAQSELKKPFKMKSDSQECRRAEVEAPTVSSAAAEAVEAGPCSEKSWPCTRTRPSATAGRPQAGPALAPSPVPTRPGAIAGGPETGSVRPGL
ncbi:unnamed protein product [Miscanthus lutarioriparius]|uniref:Uncharacterized protein n=1 Tax=Miscanthus lutarioriparius TaxID=422564 RepID=A0A811RBX6_9POAL|nr:unnamed protein product [Miscanthus lutarioriparius]